MTRTRAIVFDMDGVLIDSEELHAHAKRIAFAHAGIALTDADLCAYVGRSDAIMIDEIGDRYALTNHQRSMVLDEKTRIYEQEEKEGLRGIVWVKKPDFEPATCLPMAPGKGPTATETPRQCHHA